MPKITHGDYDLNSTFKSTIEPKYRYTKDDADRLLVWVKGNSTSDLRDESTYTRTVSESNLVSVSKNLLNSLGYDQNFNAVNFNGTNSLFSVPDSDDLSLTVGNTQDQPFSASTWVKFTDLSAVQGLYGKAAGGTSREFIVNVLTNGNLQAAIYDESVNKYIVYQTSSTLEANTWYHIVFTYSGSETTGSGRFYVNGTHHPITSAVVQSGYVGMENLGSPLYIGFAYFSTSSRLKGDLAEFAMWSKELTETSVQALYHRKGYGGYSSGFLNNPVRTIIRDRDNNLNTYPRVKRLGYPESSYAQEPFTDNSVIMYGKRIKDKFDLDPLIDNEFVQDVDDTKWLVSDRTGVRLRREEFDNDDPTNPKLPGVLSLNGVGTLSRWIRTKDKVKNATLRFTALVGPYIFSDPRSLRLYKGAVTDTLAVQVSKDGSSWTTITLNSGNVSTPYINIISGQIDPTTSLIFDAENINKLPLNLDGDVRPQFDVSINFDQLNVTSDPDASFYIRIIQSSVSTPYRAVWGIDNIKILSRDQEIVAQTGLIRSHASYLSSSVATPNFLSNMQFTGSSAPYMSDHLFVKRDINPACLPFDDSRYAIDPSDRFFKTSVSTKVLPGFSAPLSSKDLIEVDLSTNSDTRIGGYLKIGNATVPDIEREGAEENRLIVYWNNNLKRWEKMGRPVSVNNFGATSTAANILNVLTSSAIGFSSYGVMASGSKASSGIDTTAKLLPRSILNSYNRPTDSFGFPFSGRYHATSSQYVTAKDIGITKPFVFEKAVLDFDMALQTGAAQGAGLAALYVQNKYYEESGTDGRMNIYTPSFFILTQRPGNFDTIISVQTGSDETTAHSYLESIPGSFKLNSGSDVTTKVTDVRELVTYGQHSFVLSSSFGSSGIANVSFQDFLQSPLVRDSFAVYERPTNSVNGYTGSFSMNFPVRSTSRIAAFSPLYVIQKPGSGMGASAISGLGSYYTAANLRLGKQKDGRSYGGLTSTSRALVNGIGAFTPSKDRISIQYRETTAITSGQNYFTNPVVTADANSVDKPSPYVIFPEDKLIFGWQAPLGYRMIDAGGSSFANSHMQLFGNSKLKMYGSFVQDGTEFHEGLNQNLTTNAVHEVIGNDPVVDRFAVATREELTGSFYDDFPFFNGGNTAPTVFGRNIPAVEKSSRVVDLRTFSQINAGSSGRSRLNQPVFSLNSASGFGTVQKSFSPQISSNVSLADASRNFSDSRLTRLKSNTQHFKMFVANDRNAIPASYGSMQNVYATSADGGRKLRLGGTPKYLFSGKHFGHYADMLKQGHDGAFVDDPSTDEDNVVVEPAVKVRFVESEYDTNNDDLRTFKLIEGGNIDGSAYQQFQSSNISNFATSSLPFVDDGLVRNRTYGNAAVEVI